MQTYTKTAMLLHWLMFFLISGLFVVGFYMADLPNSPEKLKIISWHKWTGITVLLLALPRVTWRLLNAPPALPATMPAWQRLSAQWTHSLLYLLMIAMPVSGWMMSSAKGFPVVWFGVLPLPDLIEKNHDVGELLQEVHETLGVVLLTLLAVHVAAAIQHHVKDRDDVLSRMLPLVKPRR
jgi:cytochrome b561